MPQQFKHLTTLREDILDLLRKSPAAVQLAEIAKSLRIRSDSDTYEYLRQVLYAMVQEGIITRNARRRFALTERPAQGFTGTLVIHHGVASVATGNDDIPALQIKQQHLHTALDGDTVLVRPLALRDAKRPRGEVVEIIERSSTLISGTIEFDGSFHYLIPDEPRHYVDFLVAPANLNGAKSGDKVIARFLRWQHENAVPEVVIIESLGQAGQARVEFLAIHKEFRLPSHFPPEVELEAAAYQQPTKKPSPGREDLTKELVITIDPDDAKDFDDALSLRELGKGLVELGVHIADVSHYVTDGSALDREARKRGNSTYLVDGVVPMLPERLSNDICSLVPNKPRNTYSVFMTFTSKGELTDYRIAETLIISKRRFTYGEVQRIIDGEKGDHADLIHKINALATTLRERRMEAGGIDFETQELRFTLDENKVPIAATLKGRTDATGLVEECMLAANRTVAQSIKNRKPDTKNQQRTKTVAKNTKAAPLSNSRSNSPSNSRSNSPSNALSNAYPLIYRVHDDPDPEKLRAAVDVVQALGIPVPNGKLGPRQINDILASVRGRPEHAVINTLMLRSMAKAIYDPENIAHYGLGFEDYTHFTSPIRRYCDLWVHRALKEYAKGAPSQARRNELYEDAAIMSEHISLTERKAVEAERASNKLAQVMMARQFLGEVHTGVVTGVTHFGVFVQLQDIYAEGLLHLRDLNDDYYYFDEKRMQLVGRSTRRVLRYGAQILVKIARADIEKREIDLQYAEQQEETATSPQAFAKKSRGQRVRESGPARKPETSKSAPAAKKSGSQRVRESGSTGKNATVKTAPAAKKSGSQQVRKSGSAPAKKAGSAAAKKSGSGTPRRRR